MWTYSAIGFHSVAMSSDDFNVLVVGGRVRRDMVRLQKLLSVLGHGPHEILEDAWSDYRFRVRVSRSAYAEAVAALVTALDYESFLWAVSEVQGEQRVSVYRKLKLITHTLTEAEEDR